MALNTITLTLVIGIKISTSVVISTGIDIHRKMLIQLPLSYHHCLLVVLSQNMDTPSITPDLFSNSKPGIV